MLHILFPLHCVLCNTQVPKVEHLCADCKKNLPWQHEPVFLTAGIPCVAPFFYEEPIKWMLKQLKFGKHLQYANLLAALMLESLQTHAIALPTTIIPVPLHSKRLQERGFNQSIEIAKSLSRQLKIPLDRQSIMRSKATKPQAQCRFHERSQNIHHAFSLQEKPHNCHSIVLMDDIITTGNTLLECYTLLKNVRILPESLWAIARTP